MSAMPEGWKVITIESCCEILDRCRVPVNSEERENRIGEIPYYGANGLQGFIDSHIFDEPLILIAEDGGRFEEYATRPIAYRISGKSWVNNHAHVLRAKCDFDQDAIFYALEHKDIQHFIVGGTRAKLNQGALKAIQIQLADSKNEQSKIAEILSTVDQAIEQTEALITKQRRIKIGLMQDLFTRGIDEHGQLRTEQTHAFKDSPLGRIPVEWEVSPAEDLCLAVIDCKNRTPPITKDGHPVIRTPNVRHGEFVFDGLAWTDEKSYDVWVARGKPQIGDVVITREAPYGEACQIPSTIPAPCLGQRMMMYQTDPALLLSDYLVFALYSEAVQIRLFELAGGSTVGHIKVGDIRRLPIPHPVDVAEQELIASALSKSSTELKKLVAQRDKFTSVKAALMQDLLTGRKRVTDLLEPLAA
jgi:type I restriction enzyme S subunit